ncbi:MAG: metallophosphoesterase [Acidobacteriota bacterium]
MAGSDEKLTYRIAHLSDLHLTARDSDRRSEPKLFGPLRGMNAAFRAILGSPRIVESDLILVTGDVTDRGDPAAWAVFQSAVTEAGIAERVLVIPGNHDVCCLGLARLPRGGARARQGLKKAIEALRLSCASSRMVPADNADFDTFPWIIRPIPDLAVFGLNSNNFGNLTLATNARGDVDYYQLERLARLLWRYREIPVKILALHHSPNIPGPETAKKRDLNQFSRLEVAGHQIPKHQRQALRLLCLAHRVRLVLHGHLHRSEDRRVAGIRTIGAPATTQPYQNGGSAPCYRFFRYTLHRASARISVRLEEVPIPPKTDK